MNTDKSDTEGNTDLGEVIIEKADGGYNEKKRLMPEVKAERIQKFKDFVCLFFLFVWLVGSLWGFCLFVFVFYLLVFIHKQFAQSSNYYKLSHL